jgi:hypothetical protein
MQSKVQKMHFERIGHKESEIPFVRHYPKNFVSFGQMVNQKQASPIWKNLLIIIYMYAREDYLLSDRLSLLPG